MENKQIKIIVSDFHVAKGRLNPDKSTNLLEDFLYDQKFKELLEYYNTSEYRKTPCELIINGDFLNMIQTDYNGYFPSIITEGVSQHKIDKIILGHPILFDALKDFATNPKNSITYVLGNHDIEMIWKSCRDKFQERIGVEVNWKNIIYRFDGFHVEHGNQYEAINYIPPKKFFLTKGLPEPIINLPWATLFVINFMVKLKLERPYIDRVKPFRRMLWWGLIHDTWQTLKHSYWVMKYFISTRFRASKYRHSNIHTTIKILTQVSIYPALTNVAKKILKKEPDIHTVILGHTHNPCYRQYGKGKEYLNSGTWTEMLSLDLSSFGSKSKLTYVIITYPKDGSRPRARLRQWRGQWNPDEEMWA
jgi:UDP-2,3-diacylglucosamine pyrophosphatase LpxH